MRTQVNGATFSAFGLKIGLPKTVINRELESFVEKNAKTEELIEQSLLENKTKRAYLMHYQNTHLYLSTYNFKVLYSKLSPLFYYFPDAGCLLCLQKQLIISFFRWVNS